MNKVSGRYEVKQSRIGPGGARTLYEMHTVKHIHSFEVDADGKAGKTETRLIDDPDKIVNKMNGHDEVLSLAFRSMAMKMHKDGLKS